MKAAVIRAFGGPEQIKIEDIAMPTPGAGEVLVKVLAVGINRLDHYVRLGHIAPQLAFPHILGSDAVGEVVETGADASRFQVGDRVIAMPGYPTNAAEADIRPVTAAQSYCIPGIQIPGTYAQYIVVPERWLLRDTTGLPVEQVAALPVSLLIAIRSVQIVGEVKKGDRVLVHAGASSTGMMSIQVARALGACVATTVLDEPSAKLAASLGAELVINTSKEDFVDALNTWTDGQGVDVAIDNLGGDILPKTIAAVKPLGIIVAMGFMAGTDVTLDIRNFFFTQKQLRGTLVGDIEDFAAWLDPINAGKVKPVIDSILPLSKAADAHRRIAANEAQGSIVLLPWAA
ncbi:NADPH:quinone reductase [Mesorhizobium albiziae]|uniref:NADPH:quinone reductase n=1 Tax=Neomesorhizobium albiziae TaxID=335020 RepID=A0A1I4D8Y8_9HYPH|nr:zinc-binding dehydrogenase [Mesorhizobium albiziae]GLS33611.1 alcohol dehydrogenase [Mesorhizobium albiziae]SFK89280.1 NADPH:quinone reductase [Mesorhizobium albiziae]